MQVRNLVRKFSNLPDTTIINIMRDGFDKDLSLQEALQCKRRVLFFSYYPEVFTFGMEDDDGHPELIIEIE